MAITRTHSRSTHPLALAHREILLVEDQKSLARMAAKLLHERWGCQVLIATDYSQVAAIIAQGGHDFFLAVSDLNLPDAPDGEVVDALLAAGIPVVAMTGAFDDRQYEKYVSKGVIDYILKDGPNAYEYLVRLVGRLHRNAAIKVLVIDDSPTFIELTRKMLSLQNLQVLAASDAERGLELLQAHPEIRLVLVDYVMPGMDGCRFLVEVRRRLAMERLAIVGMAGDSDRRLSAKFLKAGASDFIFKPFTYEELTCRVTQNLEMLESVEAMRRAAYFDALTGLPNRRHFFDSMSGVHARAQAAGQELHVALLDIDFFKKVNDTYGHDVGDLVLKHIGQLLMQHFQGDFVARLGGEEFAIVVTGKPLAGVRAQFEGFRVRVAESPLRTVQHSIGYTVSIGVNSVMKADLDSSLKQADELLYEAKRAGRNRVVFNPPAAG